MKCVYWRPLKVSRPMLVAVGILSICGLAVVKFFPTTWRQPDYELKMAAARRAQAAMAAIKRERVRRGHRFSPRFDPAETGLIGAAMTPVTSRPASLRAKQTSVNPNFAAAVVSMLREAGVQTGDCVAVGYTGSFPALDLCVCAALETLQVRPIVIASAASSQFGANDADFLWVDMERILFEHGLISFRSTRASLGGYGDRGRGMSDQAIELLIAAIERNGLRLLRAKTLTEAIDERMRVYRNEAGGRPIKAYINVGGGAASIRGDTGRDLYRSGLNTSVPAGATAADSVTTRFALQGTPVINLLGVEQLADQYGLARAPIMTPAVGMGEVFVRTAPSRCLAAVVLLGILAALRSLVLSGFGHQIAGYLRWRRYLVAPGLQPWSDGSALQLTV